MVLYIVVQQGGLIEASLSKLSFIHKELYEIGAIKHRWCYCIFLAHFLVPKKVMVNEVKKVAKKKTTKNKSPLQKA